jgi:hypothetical protein
MQPKQGGTSEQRERWPTVFKLPSVGRRGLAAAGPTLGCARMLNLAKSGSSRICSDRIMSPLPQIVCVVAHDKTR